jgi:peptidoglycan/xylan/chitin deacetylase (PgdA/CDA1 family)
MTRIPILLYHSIAEDCDPRFREWAVSPHLFAAHMGHLAENGYRSLTVRELVDRVFERPLPLPARPVVITFDDGFADFHAAAWPALRRHGLRATVFVATGAVGGASTWLSPLGEGERPMLTWAQIAELGAAGIELGAHGHRHLQLDTVSSEEARADIVASKLALEEATGPVASFAYPHGYYTGSLRRLVERVGFAGACGVKDGMSSTEDDRFALARIVVRGGTDVESFGRIVWGEGTGVPGRRTVRRGAWRALRRVGAEPPFRCTGRR